MPKQQKSRKDPQRRRRAEKLIETAKEFQKLQYEQWELFCKKQMDYGPTNISMGTPLATDGEKRLSLVGLIVRINDKVQRLLNLMVKNCFYNTSKNRLCHWIQTLFYDISCSKQISISAEFRKIIPQTYFSVGSWRSCLAPPGGELDFAAW